jgi:serine protease Do
MARTGLSQNSFHFRLVIFFLISAVWIGPGRAEKSKSPFPDVASGVRPTVVSISSSLPRGNEISWARFRRSPAAQRFGSGFILDAEGHILTNNHVVNEAFDIQVALSDGIEYPAEIVGQDPDTDLALLKIFAPRLLRENRIAKLGSSDSVTVGDWVMAVGSPFGFHHTVSVGVISAKGRHLDKIEGEVLPPPYQDFLQTDASINPGNSGGPLVDLEGRVVGVNTAYNPGGNGIGFAIPIDLARRIAEELLRHGEIIRGYLGVHPQDLTPDLAEALGRDVETGVLVAEVEPGSPAEKAGLARGDLILKLAGNTVRNGAGFLKLVARQVPEKVVEIEIVRDDSVLTLSGKPVRRTSSLETATVSSASNIVWPGMEVSNRWDLESRRLSVSRTGQGVVVTYVSPGGPADKKEIERGDVVLEIGDVAIWNVRDYQILIGMVQDHAKPTLVLVLKKNEGHTWYVALRQNSNPPSVDR